jgi:hypothetical protein
MSDHDYDGNSMRCIYCDCRPWGRWASLPCGTTTRDGVPPQPLSVREFVERAAIYQAAMGNYEARKERA